MSDTPPVLFRHIGLCTSQLERSVRFYTEALGFSLKHAVDDIGAPFDTLLELPGSKCSIRQVQLGDVTVELLGFSGVATEGSGERRPMNHLGLTHLTLAVDDLDQVLERVEQFGGRIHPETRVESHFGPIVFCSDPDGVRIELMKQTP